MWQTSSHQLLDLNASIAYAVQWPYNSPHVPLKVNFIYPQGNLSRHSLPDEVHLIFLLPIPSLDKEGHQ